MRGKIKHGKKIAVLFLLMAINTIYGNINIIDEKIDNVAEFIESIEIDPFVVFRGGQPSDPSHFGNF